MESDEGLASADLKEMIAANLPKGGDVRVIVQTGGALKWSRSEVDAARTQRWEVSGDGLTLLQSLPRENMGDGDTLRDFITFAVNAAPASRYSLVLWDHGSGPLYGACYDERTDDLLSLIEIQTALRESERANGFKLDFIGFDACLMGSFEVARYLENTAEYLVASEELIPGTGWNYKKWLSWLRENPNAPSQDIAKRIIDTYIDENTGYLSDEAVTLSAIDLSKIDKLGVEFEKFSVGLIRALDSGIFAGLSRQRQGVRALGEMDDSAEWATDLVDMGLLIDAYADVLGVDTAAFHRALDQAVVYSRHSANMSGVTGLSVLAPMKTADDLPEYIYEYDMQQLFPNYTEFITAMTTIVSDGSYTFQSYAPTPLNGGAPLSIGQIAAFINVGSAAAVQPTEEPSTGNAPSWFLIPEKPAETTVTPASEDVYAYELSLSAEDMEYLAYAEGNLMLDISDETIECYIELGYLRNVQTDWENHRLISLFDGTWPTLEGQLVSITDQLITDSARRSVIDVTVNGEESYLLVVFDDKRPGGEVVGYTEGYNEQGYPVRGYKPLQPGDIIVPMYDLLYWDDSDEPQYDRLEGDAIVYTGAPLSFAYESLREDETNNFVYGFCLNDVFGSYEFSDFIEFSL